MGKKIAIFLPAAVVVMLFVFFFIPNSRKGDSEEVVPSPTSMAEEISDEQTIKSLLDTKYNLDPSSTKLTLVENKGNYAVGGFNEVASPAGGGQWFAAKVNG